MELSPEEAFEVLGLPLDASDEDIIGAYRRLIKDNHPDAGGSDSEAAKINIAKDIAQKFRSDSSVTNSPGESANSWLILRQKQEFADRRVAYEINSAIAMRVSRLSRQRSVLVVLSLAAIAAIFVFPRIMTSLTIYDFALLSFGMTILGLPILAV